MSKHTPGPWENGGLQRILLLDQARWEEWWGVFRGTDLIALAKSPHDARLVATEPDLVAVLRRAASASVNLCDCGKEPSCDCVGIAARAIIAKATGAAS